MLGRHASEPKKFGGLCGYCDRELARFVMAPTGSTPEDLVGLLRAVWLECCGHPSGFEIDPAPHV